MRDAENLGRVAQLPVAELMSKDGDYLVILALLDQRIIDDDVLLPRKTEEVGIAMSAALAAIDDVEFMQWELQLLCQVLHIGLEFALLQWRQLVEEREDDNWVDGYHEHLQPGAEHPEIIEELVACLLDDRQEPKEDRRNQEEEEHVGLDQVSHEQFWSLLIETKLLLEHKCLIDARGK